MLFLRLGGPTHLTANLLQVCISSPHSLLQIPLERNPQNNLVCLLVHTMITAVARKDQLFSQFTNISLPRHLKDTSLAKLVIIEKPRVDNFIFIVH